MIDGLCLPALFVFLVVRFSVVLSVVLLSPFSMSSHFNKRPVLSRSSYEQDFLLSVSTACVSKTLPNKVKGLICHRDFNSTTYKVTGHIVYIVSFIS